MARDKIKCEHIGSVVTEEQCIECSLHDPPCPYTTSILRRFYQETREDEDPLEVLHVTDLLKCPRQALWRKIYSYTEDVDTLYWRVRGTALHAVMERSQTPEKVIQEFPFEYPIKFKGKTFKIRGRIDEFDTETGILIDYKTTAEVPLFNPYAAHSQQIRFYAFFLNKLGYKVKKAYIVYLDMKRIVKHEVKLGTLATIEAELKDALRKYVENMLHPNEAPNFELGPLCAYCPLEIMLKCTATIFFELTKDKDLTVEDVNKYFIDQSPLIAMKESAKKGKKRSYTRRRKKEDEKDENKET